MALAWHGGGVQTPSSEGQVATKAAGPEASRVPRCCCALGLPGPSTGHGPSGKRCKMTSWMRGRPS
eukprot:6785492-Pyramimonas_sp.AAC.1